VWQRRRGAETGAFVRYVPRARIVVASSLEAGVFCASERIGKLKRQLVAPHGWGNPAGRVYTPASLYSPWREMDVC
jgi:hypothetical protein